VRLVEPADNVELRADHHGHAHVVFSFPYRADMVDAVCLMIERPQACRGQILNLGNPNNELSIAELGHLLAQEFAELVPRSRPARFEHVSALQFYGEGYDDTDQRVPDIGKARRILGWQPKVGLREMLPDILRDYIERYGARIPSQSARSPLPQASVA